MTLTAPMILDETVGSPDWWLLRLHKALTARRPVLDIFDDYYRGEHPTPWLLDDERRETFRSILRLTRSNYMGLVVDAVAELARIEGFRLGDDRDRSADTKTWDLWQANNLDLDSDLGILESLIGGTSYLMVEPNGNRPDLPLMHVEHASQVIVDYVPGSNRRTAAAGLKAYVDDWTGDLFATVQARMDDGFVYLFKYRAPAPRHNVASTPEWSRRVAPGEPWGVRSPFSEVSVFELPNNPRILTGGRSEIADLTDIQDRVNKTIADRLFTQDFGAWPQWWATGYPTEDRDGNAVEPVDIGRDRMITTDVAETKFGQFSVAPLDPYSAAKREDIRDIAARSRTPADYLLGEMNNINGETLKASRAGLVAKTKQRQRTWGEGVEAAVRFARQVAGLPDAGATRLEVIWSDPEYRTEGERTDATIKKLGSGIIDLQQAREDSGYTATQIDRMRDRAAVDDEQDPVLRAARALTGGASGTPTGG